MWQFFKRFAPFFSGYRLRMLLAILGGTVAAAGTYHIYRLIEPVMDGVFIEGDRHLHRLVPILIVVYYFFYSAGRYLQTYELCWIGEDIVRRVRDRLLSHVLEFDLAFFNRYRGGELISRVTNDIMRIRVTISQNLAVLVREALQVVALLAVVIATNWRLAFYGLVVLPVAAWPLAALARRFKRIMHRSQEKDSDITSRLSEIFNNMEIIKASSSERFEAERFERDNLEFRRINMKGVRTREMTNPLMEFLGSIGAALVIWFGGFQIIEGNMTTGQWATFAGALFGLYTPIKRVSQVYNQMFEAVAASDRIFDMLGREPAIRSGSRRLDGPVLSVEIDDVRLSYGEVNALRGVSLRVGAGETVALVGDSGGGKSSLVNLVPRLYDPTAGVVRINGIDSRELDIPDLRSRIGVVTQRVYVFNDTVAANVAYGDEIDRARVEEALRDAGAWEFVAAMEDGVDTVLDEFGANLSGGQRQRLAIARALYKRPDILILDEATSALDNRSEAAIQRALVRILEGKIAFVIAHRLSTVDLADRIVVIAGGRVVGEGTKDELMRDCPDYRRLVEAGLGRDADSD
jgi:subfamily B ATP-binding cassette protein MsbA